MVIITGNVTATRNHNEKPCHIRCRSDDFIVGLGTQTLGTRPSLELGGASGASTRLFDTGAGWWGVPRISVEGGEEVNDKTKWWPALISALLVIGIAILSWNVTLINNLGYKIDKLNEHFNEHRLDYAQHKTETQLKIEALENKE